MSAEPAPRVDEPTVDVPNSPAMPDVQPTTPASPEPSPGPPSAVVESAAADLPTATPALASAMSQNGDATSDSERASAEPCGTAVPAVADPDESPPADDAAEPPPEELSLALTRIDGRLDELARLGQRHADHVSALHSENQRLRAGDLQAAFSPMIRDVIRLYDDLVRLTVIGSPSAPDLDIISKLLLETLDRWGVEHFEPATGDVFDTAFHAGVVRVATSEPISNTIAAVRRCGFKYDGKVLRTADVEVYQQDEPTLDSPPSDGAPEPTKEVES